MIILVNAPERPGGSARREGGLDITVQVPEEMDIKRIAEIDILPWIEGTTSPQTCVVNVMFW